MALENLVDGMSGLQLANTIKNNFEKVLDAESAENKAENAGKSIKTDYDATRYIELQLADGTPVKMKMDVFCQAIAPVVAEQFPNFRVRKKETTFGGNNVFYNAISENCFAYVVDKADKKSYLFAHVRYINNSMPTVNVISSNVLELGASNTGGTQVVNGSKGDLIWHLFYPI